MTYFFYLHGFASSPLSSKAVIIKQYFRDLGHDLIIPDFNQDDFSGLTLTRQIEQLEKLLPAPSIPVVLIGSSLGGLTSAILAEKHDQIQRMVLLAPAFNFLDHLLPKLGEKTLTNWQRLGELPVYHYTYQQKMPLKYDFIKDCLAYSQMEFVREIPTLIFHGINDDVIPLASSINYATNRPWVQLIELPSNHDLTDVIQPICQELAVFLGLVGSKNHRSASG